MDTSTCVAKIDKLVMVSHYCYNEGNIHENLITVSPAEDTTAIAFLIYLLKCMICTVLNGVDCSLNNHMMVWMS